jgi:HAMP domain-containing protein
MSATGTWVAPTRAFETSLSQLKEWRHLVAAELTAFRRWAIVSRLIDDQTMARIAHLERRLSHERLTVAFVAEYSRGKSELINGLFFSDLGDRLLPSGVGRTTLCPMEILWDASKPPGVRVLPIASRSSERALREFIAEADQWETIPIDPAKPETVAAAFQALSQAITVSAAEAAGLGFAADLPDRVELPRWRYAIVNFPHPLLASGLTVLDTPGENALTAEPELTMHRIPDAAAIVFMVAADTGVTVGDEALWKDHIAPIEGLEQTCYIALNKIDMLRDGAKSESQVLEEIDRQVRRTADALGVQPTRVFALSALQGYTARLAGDRDGLMRSRVYRLEQALAKGMVHQRRVDHAAAVLAETRAIFNEARALLESRIAFAREQRDELLALQGKNQKLVEVLAKKAAVERGRIEKARTEISALRSMHNRFAEQLDRVLNPAAIREAGIQTRLAVLNTRFSGSIGQTIDGFFAHARGNLERAIFVIAEVRAMIANAKAKFGQDYGMVIEAAPEFATERFLIELERIEDQCGDDFRSATSLLMRGRKTLGSLFFDTVALKVIHVFEIADREVRTWMASFIRPLDAQLNAFQEQTNARIEGMGRIQNAETDLVARLGELELLVGEVDGQRQQLERHRERLAALLAVEREHSLA